MSNIVIVEPNETYGSELAGTIAEAIPHPIDFRITGNQPDAVKLRKEQENQVYVISQRFYIHPSRYMVLDTRVLQLAQDLHERSLPYDRMMVILDAPDRQGYKFLKKILGIAKELGLSRFYDREGNPNRVFGVAPISELPKDLVEILGKQ